MRIVAQLIAGNSMEVLDGCIQHHRRLGIDRFLILHVYSDDSTPEYIREIAAREPDVEAVFCSVSDGVLNVAADQTLESARTKLGADWVVRIDADERWLVRDGSLRDVCTELAGPLLIAPRFNMVWADPDQAAAAGRRSLTPADVPIAANPAVISPSELDNCRIPFVLSSVAPKCLLRGSGQYRFGMGGHHVVGPGGEVLPRFTRPDVAVAQLAFTTFDRFVRKAAFAARCVEEFGRLFDETTGWQWRRWARIYHQGVAALEAEWARQFWTPAAARALLGREVVINAAEFFAAQPSV